ncbi:MAG: immunoglobulin-like domain-containing protein [Eubacterium sp.]
MSERIEKSKDIKELKRDSKKIMTYEFVAENEKGQQETIQVDINKKELTPDETYKLFKETEELLVKKVLGTNKSTQKINRPLNLVSSIGDNISVSWNISDDTIIDYDGNISDSVPEQGSIVNLTATMSLNGISADYNFAVNVLPKEENKNLQEQLQKYVDENNKYDGKVKLPKEINGQSLKYYQVLPKAGGWIVFSGVCGAIAVFFLKDQDIKKEVKKRNHQMMIDYPEIVSKILLYYNAGLSLKSGIERIVKDYKEEKQNNKKIFRYAYEELEMSLIKMKSGISEMEAINDYGNRCGLHCYIKLSGIIEQNLKRGSKEVSYALKNELNNAMLERKNAALKEGGEMSTKLLGPMILMLVISIVIVIVPAICTMNL